MNWKSLYNLREKMQRKMVRQGSKSHIAKEFLAGPGSYLYVMTISYILHMRGQWVRLARQRSFVLQNYSCSFSKCGKMSHLS